MALIKCPECGKEISDKASACPNCGCPNSEFTNQQNSELDEDNSPYTICPKCGYRNPMGEFVCRKCWHRYTLGEYHVIVPSDFSGVYRRNAFGNLEEVRCPLCHNEDCSHYQEQKIRPGKIKTTYSLNLNPLKPFTVVNKHEKVKRKEKIVIENKFICNKCGNIFY